MFNLIYNVYERSIFTLDPGVFTPGNMWKVKGKLEIMSHYPVRRRHNDYMLQQGPPLLNTHLLSNYTCKSSAEGSVIAISLLAPDSQSSLIKCKILWSMNSALKLYTIYPVNWQYFTDRMEICMAPNLLSSRLIFQHTAEAAYRLKHGMKRQTEESGWAPSSIVDSE